MSFKYQFVLFLIIIIISGCSSIKTSDSQYRDLELYAKENHFDILIQQVLNAKQEGNYIEKDKVLYYLDLGMLYHYNCEYKKSNEYLEEAERAIEELFTKSISRNAFSYVLNDNNLPYYGEDYEDIYINIFKALNYIALKQMEDAHVEIRRLDLKIRKFEDKYATMEKSYNSSDQNIFNMEVGCSQFQTSAFARYLGMLMFEVENRADDVEIDRRNVINAYKSQSDIYPFKIPDFINEWNTINQNEARLNVICFLGLSPIKIEKKLEITSYDNYLSVDGDLSSNLDSGFSFKGIPKGFHIKFSFPDMKICNSEVDFIRVRIGDTKVFPDKMEDIGNIAGDLFNRKKKMIYTKSVSRAVFKAIGSTAVKKFAEHLAKEEGKKAKKKGHENAKVDFLTEVGTDLFNYAVDSAMDATENADLRISRYIPDEVYVTEIILNPGQYDIVIEYFDSNGMLIETQNKNCIIKPGNLNIIESVLLR